MERKTLEVGDKVVERENSKGGKYTKVITIKRVTETKAVGIDIFMCEHSFKRNFETGFIRSFTPFGNNMRSYRIATEASIKEAEHNECIQICKQQVETLKNELTFDKYSTKQLKQIHDILTDMRINVHLNDMADQKQNTQP